MLLGDVVEQALSAVGLTEERVTKWLGEECNCPERREKLNQLHRWAKRVVQGKIGRAKQYLNEIMERNYE